MAEGEDRQAEAASGQSERRSTHLTVAGRAAAQPQEHRRRPAARPDDASAAGRAARARARWPSTRSMPRASGATSNRCRPTPGSSSASAEAEGRAHQRPVAGHQHRAEDDQQEPALDRRHRHRDLRLPAHPLRPAGPAVLPECQIPIGTQTADEIVEKILSLPEGTKLYLMAPLERRGQEKYEALWDEIRRAGFVRMRVDGKSFNLDEPPAIDHRRKHRVEVVVDRVVVREQPARPHRRRGRVGARPGQGRRARRPRRRRQATEPNWQVDRYSQHFACDRCGRSFEQLNPHHFSFNSPLGWCPICEGLGVAARGQPGAARPRSARCRSATARSPPGPSSTPNPPFLPLRRGARRGMADSRSTRRSSELDAGPAACDPARHRRRLDCRWRAGVREPSERRSPRRGSRAVVPVQGPVPGDRRGGARQLRLSQQARSAGQRGPLRRLQRLAAARRRRRRAGSRELTRSASCAAWPLGETLDVLQGPAS